MATTSEIRSKLGDILNDALNPQPGQDKSLFIDCLERLSKRNPLAVCNIINRLAQIVLPTKSEVDFNNLEPIKIVIPDIPNELKEKITKKATSIKKSTRKPATTRKRRLKLD